MPSSRIRSPVSDRWVFTINNPETVPLDHIVLHEHVTYLFYAEEIGEQGTDHLQGYIEFSARKARTWIVNNVPQLRRASLEIAKGTADQNVTYISKDPIDGPWEFGAVREKRPGHRSDLDEVMKAIRDGITMVELFTRFPVVMARYPKFVMQYSFVYKDSLITVPPFIPRPGWQFELCDKLKAVPDNRSIFWYWSSIGNVGKSYFANNYDPSTCTVIVGGKHTDIYYLLSAKITDLKVVFFDYTRTQADQIPYSVLETLKNGNFTSTKYESRNVRFNPVHVVVFSNQEPDFNALSLDRWDINQVS